MGTLNSLFATYSHVNQPQVMQEDSNLDVLANKYWKLVEYITKKQSQESPKESKMEETQEETPTYYVRQSESTSFSPSTNYAKQNNSFSPSTNAEIVRNYFSKHFKSKGIVAGIMGAMHGESRLNPTAINEAEKKKGYSGYGRGIFQWSNSRVDAFRKKYNAEIEDSPLETQLDFAWSEFNSRPALMRRLREIETDGVMTEQEKARQTVDAIVRGYLNGSANALATIDQMNKIYKKAWSKLEGYGDYDYETSSLNKRNKYAQGYLA